MSKAKPLDPALRFLAGLPFKRVAVLVLILSLAGEFYPLSNFPMYSRIGDDADYFYVTDETGAPIPMLERFGIRTARAKKIYYSHLVALTSTRGAARSAATADEQRLAGEKLLALLAQNMPDAQRDLLKAAQVRLVRVDLSLEEDDRFRRAHTTIASMPFPASHHP